MRSVSALTVAAGLSLVTFARGLDLKITSPRPGDILNLTLPDSTSHATGFFPITWSHDNPNEEPDLFSIALINNHTNFVRPIAENVSVAMDEYKVNRGYLVDVMRRAGYASPYHGVGFQVLLVPGEPGHPRWAALSGKFEVVG
ncbi:hypothetical protein VTN00DRAFT_3194 [Thermoascus crustaceus]|uniref:uncharacterized protein n=1 Tax=Thermoascus crustaceus TaxID=5088 RepID=UPI0037445C89